MLEPEVLNVMDKQEIETYIRRLNSVTIYENDLNYIRYDLISAYQNIYSLKDRELIIRQEKDTAKDLFHEFEKAMYEKYKEKIEEEK